MAKIDAIELEKRILAVQDWILQDYSTAQIVAACAQQWGVSGRQAKRYIKVSRARWSKDASEDVEKLKLQKIRSLQRIKQTLKPQYHGTPAGIRAILQVEQQIMKLQGIVIDKIELTGKEGAPVQFVSTIKHVLVVKKGNETLELTQPAPIAIESSSEQ